MAVGTHEFALGNLLEDASSVVLSHKVREVMLFDASRQMVPLHCDRMKHLSAVGARLTVLEGQVPAAEIGMKPSLLLEPSPTGGLVVSGVVHLPARLAPGLPTFSAPVKLA
jgi:hypothetical protein